MVPGWDVCAHRDMNIIKVDRAGEFPVPAAIFLSLRLGMLWSSSSWNCENKETAGYLSDMDTWGLIWGCVNPEQFHSIQ